VASVMPLPLYTPGKSPGAHCVGGWVEPGAGLEDMEKLKFLILLGLEHRPLDHPARSQSPYRFITVNMVPSCFAVQYEENQR
jgi:hypothetical protein